MAAASHGARADTAKRLAKIYGVSVATVYRHAERRGTRRRREPARPEYRDWVRIAVQLSHRSPKPMPLDVAIEGGIAMGLIPAEATAMPLATAQRVRRELGLVKTNKRTHRLHADYPMQALLVDGSTSQYLTVQKALGDGDYLLKLHKAPYPASGYKNKPLGPDRLRVLVYGVWDMCTGYVLSRYCVGKGETALAQMEFLAWVFEQKEDPRVVMHGLPDDLWSDLGSFYKAQSTRDLCEELDIFVPPTVAYAKERMGGVERPHRTRWSRLERSLFLRREQTLTLSELNARLTEYEIKENGRNARIPMQGRFHSRTATWVALTNARPADNRLRRMPANAIQTMAKKDHRTIDNNGILTWDGVEYECKAWHGRRVLAHRALDGAGNLMLLDESTKERTVAVPYQPRPYGEIRSAPANELDKLLAEDLDAPGADIYAPGGDDTKVVPMPTRSAPAAALDNPFGADSFASLDEAMVALDQLVPYALSPANRALAMRRIEDSDLNREVVESLGLQLAALGAQQRR